MIEPVRGRPWKLKSPDKQAFTRLVANSGTRTALDAMRTINLGRKDNDLLATVRRAIWEEGLRGIKKVKKTQTFNSTAAIPVEMGFGAQNLDS